MDKVYFGRNNDFTWRWWILAPLSILEDLIYALTLGVLLVQISIGLRWSIIDAKVRIKYPSAFRFPYAILHGCASALEEVVFFLTFGYVRVNLSLCKFIQQGYVNPVYESEASNE